MLEFAEIRPFVPVPDVFNCMTPKSHSRNMVGQTTIHCRNGLVVNSKYPGPESQKEKNELISSRHLHIFSSIANTFFKDTKRHGSAPGALANRVE